MEFETTIMATTTISNIWWNITRQMEECLRLYFLDADLTFVLIIVLIFYYSFRSEDCSYFCYHFGFSDLIGELTSLLLISL